MSAGQGSTGNVIAAVCSFFIPGLGQLVQGRLLKAGHVCAGGGAVGDLDGLDHSPVVDHRRGALQAGQLRQPIAHGCAESIDRLVAPMGIALALFAVCDAGAGGVDLCRHVSRNFRATRIAARAAHCRCLCLRHYAANASARRHDGMQRGRRFVMHGRWIVWRRASSSVAISRTCAFDVVGTRDATIAAAATHCARTAAFATSARAWLQPGAGIGDAAGARVESALSPRRSATRAAHGRKQTTLNAAERRRNLNDAFALREGVELPPHIALLDDVFTTGATLAECTKVLKRAGVTRVDVWALARAPIPGR
jgi:hypothetical protein